MSLSPLNLEWSQAKLPPTPFYYYDETVLKELYTEFSAAVKKNQADVKLHLAIKANNNPALLKFFASKGCGTDIVSGGELELSLKLGFKAKDIIFSGVGKTEAELKLALKKKIFMINIESTFEFDQLENLCEKTKTRARISFRVNPDVDAKTHPYIATGLYEHKFGLAFEEALPLYRRAAASPYLDLQGISLHIGSQLLNLSPVDEAIQKTIAFAKTLKDEGIALKSLDIGGGVGISYDDPTAMPPFAEYGKVLGRATREWKALQGPKADLHSACGRALVGPAGWLITRVLGIKKNPRKSFAVVDASMSELLRPALYSAKHPMFRLAASGKSLKIEAAVTTGLQKFEVVGPVCESSDVLHPEAKFPADLKAGDIIAIGCAGAYGYTMSSFYNVRAMPAEYFSPLRGGVRLSRRTRSFLGR